MTYRQTAVEGASGFGLLIALYDTLASDLRSAAAAQQVNDLEKRSARVNHAFTVLGFLENWVEPGSGELADGLVMFYARLRRKMIEAQAKQSAKMLEDLMTEALSIREVWQQLDTATAASGPEILPPVRTQKFGGAFQRQVEQQQLSWSA